VTVIADDNKRVALPNATPGERFDLQSSSDGFTLRRLEAAAIKPAKVTVEKRQGFSVWATDQPISEQAIREALADFPP
jgi:hypothetical protein